MLKRRRRIQKYISALKSKKQNLSKHVVLQYKLSDQQNPQKIQQKNVSNNNNNLFTSNTLMQKTIQTNYLDTNSQQQQPMQEQLWHDSDQDNNQLHIQSNKNVFKKLNLSQQTNQKQYEGKLKQFYQKKYKLKNWASVGDGEQQLDLQDYLDQEENYQSEKQNKKSNQIVKHFGRTTEKHNSIVTGLDWYNDVLFTCGYDQKLKIFKVNQNQQNSDLKIKQQKDILLEKLPISTCYYNKGSVYCGTLRKNIAIIDVVKQKITYFTSSFLSDHKKYQNLRLSKETNQKLLFSANKISIIDYKNTYSGSLLASDQLKDVKFGKNPYELYGITHDSIFQWDLRMYKPIRISKTYLGYTSLQLTPDYLCLGSRLGMIYINQTTKSSQEQFKLHYQNKNITTSITDLSINKQNSLILALSKWKSNSARVIDIHKGKCIGNWPTTKTNIQFANVAKWADKGNMFAVGSSNGYVNLFNFGQNQL